MVMVASHPRSLLTKQQPAKCSVLVDLVSPASTIETCRIAGKEKENWLNELSSSHCNLGDRGDRYKHHLARGNNAALVPSKASAVLYGDIENIYRYAWGRTKGCGCAI